MKLKIQREVEKAVDMFGHLKNPKRKSNIIIIPLRNKIKTAITSKITILLQRKVQ